MLIRKLIEAQKVKGLSQNQLAEPAGLKKPVIARLESMDAILQIDTLSPNRTTTSVIKYSILVSYLFLYVSLRDEKRALPAVVLSVWVPAPGPP